MPDQTDETSFPIRNPRLAKSFPELTEMTTGPSKRPMQQPLTNYFRKRPKDNPSESNEPQRPSLLNQESGPSSWGGSRGNAGRKKVERTEAETKMYLH